MRGTGIVIPAYNGERTLRETVASVRAQTRAPVEVVAVDDGSSDGSAALLEELGIRVVSQPNAGVCAARNRGRAELTTYPEYLLFLDQDDLLEPEMLQTMEDYLAAHPEVGLVYCGLQMIDGEGKPLADSASWPPRHAPGRLFWPRLVPDDDPVTPLLSIIDLVAIVPAVSLIRASVFDSTPGWDVSFRRGGAEDTALAVEIGLRSQVHHVPRQLVRYRWHEAQESSDRERLYAAQRRLHEGLRQRPEAAIRAASRARDEQLRLKRTVLDACDAYRSGDLKAAARSSGSAGKTVVRILLGRAAPR
jgi:glycosyltransferase involved in cell wall biosynthesis